MVVKFELGWCRLVQQTVDGMCYDSSTTRRIATTSCYLPSRATLLAGLASVAEPGKSGPGLSTRRTPTVQQTAAAESKRDQVPVARVLS